MYIMSYSDRWLLTFLASIKSAGLYIAAYTLPSQILIAIMMGMHLNLYPKDICAYETGSAKKQKLNSPITGRNYSPLSFQAALD